MLDVAIDGLFAGGSPYDARGDERAQCCYTAHNCHSDVALCKKGEIPKHNSNPINAPWVTFFSIRVCRLCAWRFVGSFSINSAAAI